MLRILTNWVDRAIELGYRALAITDENTLAGVVRAYSALRDAKKRLEEENTLPDPETGNLHAAPLKLIIGAEIILNDALPIVLWATDRTSYAQLTRLLTVGRRRAPKGECWLCFDDIANHHAGLMAGIIPEIRGDRDRTAHIDETHTSYPWFAEKSFAAGINDYRELFGDRAYLLADSTMALTMIGELHNCSNSRNDFMYRWLPQVMLFTTAPPACLCTRRIDRDKTQNHCCRSRQPADPKRPTSFTIHCIPPICLCILAGSY